MNGFDLAELRAAVRERGTVARIVVAGTKGSTPREPGTSMLVWRDGQLGTIGGGALELAAVDHARERLDSPTGASTLNMPLGPGLGQCCGGFVNLVVEVFDEQSLEDETTDSVRLRRTGSPHDSGHAADEPPTKVRKIVESIRDGTSPPSASLVDGWLIEPAAQSERSIWVYGAGHVGRAVIEVLAGLPFAVTWVDFDVSRFPENIAGTVRPVVSDPTSLHAVGLAPDDADHLVMTHTHAIDLDICNRVMGRNFRSLGLIGSRTKRQRFVGRLQALGHSEETISRLVCPIGIPDLGKHPRAIAIGVAAGYLIDSPEGIGPFGIGDVLN